ncbi:hypothetical protein [Paractinoplanes globisporus]|uniref:Uncharacterized protein n=1 Tax=Paractinoplanes globisporus TaxID=113565 RepID=A0ABW6WTT4_9ACTN|nr:hypothetical protein [Actinoplanes globisporus]
MTGQAHWHGYGPWTGPHGFVERGNDQHRRPGPERSDAATVAFVQNTMPPLETGHYLLRRAQTGRDRTWTAVDDALRWLCETYQRHPPAPELNFGPLDARCRHTRAGLEGGSDAVWHYTTSGNGDRVAVFAVVCCPHRYHPGTPCPLPPN